MQSHTVGPAPTELGNKAHAPNPVGADREAWFQVVLEDMEEGEEEIADGGAPSKAACLPASIELWLPCQRAAGTGGFLWAAGGRLARWLFAGRGRLGGRRVLELGCGLGLPSMVAAHFAAEVLATDVEPTLVENVGRSAERLRKVVAGSLSACRLDFTSARALRAVGLGAWDVVLFSDCIYNAQAGAALPYALRSLLRPRGACGGAEQPMARGSLAVGAMPAEKRPGMGAFWDAVAAAGLAWQVEGEDCSEGDGDAEGDMQATDARGQRLCFFWLASEDPMPTQQELEEIIGEPDNESDGPGVLVEPLFAGIC